MERVEAEGIVDGDRESAVGLLLRLDDLVVANQRLVEANERLEGRVAELPSFPGPGITDREAGVFMTFASESDVA